MSARLITISKKLFDQMLEHAKKGYPNEACGILAGAAAGAVTHFYPMKNVDESSISYFMDPKEQLKVFKDMRAAGLQMTAIYHTHVASDAYPSQKDIRLAFYPDVHYLILSLSDMKKPLLRAFTIENESVKEEEVHIG